MFSEPVQSNTHVEHRNPPVVGNRQEIGHVPDSFNGKANASAHVFGQSYNATAASQTPILATQLTWPQQQSLLDVFLGSSVLRLRREFCIRNKQIV